MQFAATQAIFNGHLSQCSRHKQRCVVTFETFPAYPTTPKEVEREQQYIRVSPSTIAGAGLGVFTRRDIPGDFCLGIYRGEQLTLALLHAQNPDGHGQYAFKFGQVYADAYDEARNN